MIASGKSTYAKELANKGFITVNDDAIVSILHGGDYTLYNKLLKPIYKSIETAIANYSLVNGNNIVVDRGLNVSKKARQRWIGLGRSFDCIVKGICFLNEGPGIHARRRYDTDPRGHDFEHWLEAAERHHLNWDTPSISEGFDDIEFVKYNPETKQFDLV